MISPPSASPMSHYSSKFGGDNAFDPPTPPRHIEPVSFFPDATDSD